MRFLHISRAIDEGDVVNVGMEVDLVEEIVGGAREQKQWAFTMKVKAS